MFDTIIFRNPGKVLFVLTYGDKYHRMMVSEQSKPALWVKLCKKFRLDNGAPDHFICNNEFVQEGAGVLTRPLRLVIFS